MSTKLLHRQIRTQCRPITRSLATRQAWVSTTSAINRGLRSTKTDGGRSRDRDGFNSSSPSRFTSQDKPSFRDRRRLSDQVAYEGARLGRNSAREDRNSYRSTKDRGSGDGSSSRPSQSRTSFGARDRGISRPLYEHSRPSRNNDRSDSDGAPRDALSSFTSSGRPSYNAGRPQSDRQPYQREQRTLDRHSWRNRLGQRERQDRGFLAKDQALSSSQPSIRDGQSDYEFDEGSEGASGQQRRGLLKSIKDSCRAISWIQEKQSTGGDISDLVHDVKRNLKTVNALIRKGVFQEDEPAEAVVSLFRKKANNGTFLAGDMPDGTKSVIFVNDDGAVDLSIGKVDSNRKPGGEQIRETRLERTQSFEDRSDRRERDDRKQKPSRFEDEPSSIPVSVPYTTAASQFLYGYNSVLAALRAKRRKLYKLYIHQKDFDREAGAEGTHSGLRPFDELIALAEDAHVPIKHDPHVSLLYQMSEQRPHNGVVLEASKLPSPPVLGLLKPEIRKGVIPLTLDQQNAEDAKVNGTPQTISSVSNTWRYPLILMLDGITDPGNVGNIIRTAHFYGVDAIAIATNTCANLSSAVLAKASSGACEAIRIISLPKPSSFIHDSSRYKWKIYAAMAPDSDGTRQDSTTTTALSLASPLAQHPCILMLGAEGAGLRANLRARADKFVSIKGAPRAEDVPDVGVDSMNVSVAAGVLLEAFMRKPEGAPENLGLESSDMGF